MSRFLIQHPGETRLALLVDVVDNAVAGVEDLRSRMFETGCAHGMVIDEREVIVLRDTFFEMDDSSIVTDFKLDTVALLGVAGSLDARVWLWLRRMSANWRAVLEELGAEGQRLLFDIVPALSGAAIDQLDDHAA